MKVLKASGMGFDRIASALNAAGFQTRAGKPWHGLVVNQILTGEGEDGLSGRASHASVWWLESISAKVQGAATSIDGRVGAEATGGGRSAPLRLGKPSPDRRSHAPIRKNSIPG
jgi:hypothetical protein